MSGTEPMEQEALDWITQRIVRLPAESRMGAVGAFKATYERQGDGYAPRREADGIDPSLVFLAYSASPDPVGELQRAKELVGSAVERRAARLRTESIAEAKLAVENERQARAQEAVRYAAAQREHAALVEQVRRLPDELARSMKPPVVNVPAPVVNVPAQQGIDVEALAHLIRSLMPPPLDVEALAKALKPERKPKTVTTVKNKDGSYTTTVEE